MSEQQYDNEARFVIFPNANKEANSKQPDYTGEMTLNGEKLRLSGWRNTSKKGVTYVAGKISEFQERGATEGVSQVSVASQAREATSDPRGSDNIPF